MILCCAESKYALRHQSSFKFDAALDLFVFCRKCIHLVTQKEYAVKIISRRLDTAREVQLLRQCRGHPNIVQLVDVCQDQWHTYIVLELLRGGELLDRIRSQDSFTEAEASRIMRSLVSAVKFMHSLGIVHRDLKPEVCVSSYFS